MHIVKQGGVRAGQADSSFPEPAVCLIDGLRAINGMQLGQTCALARTPHRCCCAFYLHVHLSSRAGIKEVQLRRYLDDHQSHVQNDEGTRRPAAALLPYTSVRVRVSSTACCVARRYVFVQCLSSFFHHSFGAEGEKG